MERIAIFGGTFDPVHNGHLKMADAIFEQNLADRIFLMPAKIPPHKIGEKITSDSIRMKMLCTVLKEKMEVCRCELDRDNGVTSYSYQTMRDLREVYPNDKLIFVMGMDSLNTLQFWRKFDEFIEENEFIVFTRPGQQIPRIQELTENFHGRQDLAQKMLESIVNIDNYPLSSTIVREEASRGADISDMVPPSVAEIIKENNLYRPSTEE